MKVALNSREKLSGHRNEESPEEELETDFNQDKERQRYMNSENNIRSGKACAWTLQTDIHSNPPLLADMGLAMLSEDMESSQAASGLVPAVVNKETCQSRSQSQELIVPASQGFPPTNFLSDSSSEGDFFVFKRRRISSPHGEDKFNCLLDELVLQIFKCLPRYMLARCAQVCRRWKRLSLDESLWKRLDLGGKTLKGGVVGQIILRGTSIVRLSKSEVLSPIFSPSLQHLPPVKSRLQYVDLSMAGISVQALEELLTVCYDLRKISLEHCILSVRCLKSLAQNAHLDTLNLAMCYGVSSEGLVPLLKSCRRLEFLNLAWTHLMGLELTAVVSSLPSSLLRLNISGCRSHLTDRHIGILTNACPKLIELDVSDGTHLTTDAIGTVVSKSLHLEYLALSRCYGIQPDCFLDLLMLPKLVFLDVYGLLNEPTLASLRHSLPSIQINKYLFSSVARPTVGIRRTSIWGIRVRD